MTLLQREQATYYVLKYNQCGTMQFLSVPILSQIYHKSLIYGLHSESNLVITCLSLTLHVFLIYNYMLKTLIFFDLA